MAGGCQCRRRADDDRSAMRIFRKQRGRVLPGVNPVAAGWSGGTAWRGDGREAKRPAPRVSGPRRVVGAALRAARPGSAVDWPDSAALGARADLGRYGRADRSAAAKTRSATTVRRSKCSTAGAVKRRSRKPAPVCLLRIPGPRRPAPFALSGETPDIDRLRAAPGCCPRDRGVRPSVGSTGPGAAAPASTTSPVPHKGRAATVRTPRPALFASPKYARPGRCKPCCVRVSRPAVRHKGCGTCPTWR